MILSMRMSALALVLATAVPARSQVLVGHTSSENGVGPVAPCALTDASGRPVLCSAANPLPITAGPLATAASTPLGWSVTTATTVGPFLPALGRAIWITKSTADTASLVVTATTDGNCAHGVPLTAANASYTIGSFANVSTAFSENLGGETRASAGWCVTITPTNAGVIDSGSLGQ